MSSGQSNVATPAEHAVLVDGSKPAQTASGSLRHSRESTFMDFPTINHTWVRFRGCPQDCALQQAQTTSGAHTPGEDRCSI
ncbi:hypothetical protein JB92DRAFT_2862006 [Gautieria morchelliformis]|nr:hypothetical protein JB92DRAFT_2862006 [Gautieria morchelliformis]